MHGKACTSALCCAKPGLTLALCKTSPVLVLHFDAIVIQYKCVVFCTDLRIASPRFLDEDSPLALVALRPRSPLTAPLPPARPPTGNPPRLWAERWGPAADCPLNSLPLQHQLSKCLIRKEVSQPECSITQRLLVWRIKCSMFFFFSFVKPAKWPPGTVALSLLCAKPVDQLCLFC